MPFDCGSAPWQKSQRDESVMGGEPHVIRRRDNDIGDHAAFETAHPVSQDLGRHPTDRLKGFGDHRQRGGGLLITSEAHEPPPRIRQDRAEHRTTRVRLRPSPSPDSHPVTTPPDAADACSVCATTLSAPRPDAGSCGPNPDTRQHTRDRQHPLRRHLAVRALNPSRD